MIITAIGAVICLYLAADLYQTFASYDRTPPSDYIFVFALIGIGTVFSLATLAFWFFPWSWATMTVGKAGIYISVSGWGAFPEVHFDWHTLDTITLVILPRGASVLHLSAKDGHGRTVRTWAFADGPDAYLAAFEDHAKAAGYALKGSKLKSPVLGKRGWHVERSEG